MALVQMRKGTSSQPARTVAAMTDESNEFTSDAAAAGDPPVRGGTAERASDGGPRSNLAGSVFAAFTVASTLAWVAAVVAAFGNASEVSSIAGRRFNPPSAVQISQVADEAIVAAMPSVVLSLALTCGLIASGFYWAGTRVAAGS